MNVQPIVAIARMEHNIAQLVNSPIYGFQLMPWQAALLSYYHLSTMPLQRGKCKGVAIIRSTEPTNDFSTSN